MGAPRLEEVHIGAALTDLDTGFLTGSDALRTLTVSADNPVYSAENNVLYAKQQDGTHLVLSLPSNTFTEYSVRPGTVQIDAQEFHREVDRGAVDAASQPDLALSAGADEGGQDIGAAEATGFSGAGRTGGGHAGSTRVGASRLRGQTYSVVTRV